MQDTTLAPPSPAARPTVAGAAATTTQAGWLPRLAADAPVYLALYVTGFIFIVPFLWMFLTSFKPTEDVFRYTSPLTWKTFIPPVPTLANYTAIFTTWNFQRDLMNTLIAASGQVIGACITSTLAAFVFARLR